MPEWMTLSPSRSTCGCLPRNWNSGCRSTPPQGSPHSPSGWISRRCTSRRNKFLMEEFRRKGGFMPEQQMHNSRILIVDDQRVNVVLLEGILRNAGYRDLVSTTDPSESASLFRNS